MVCHIGDVSRHTREVIPRGAVPSGTSSTVRGGESPSRAVEETLIEVSDVAALEVLGLAG